MSSSYQDASAMAGPSSRSSRRSMVRAPEPEPGSTDMWQEILASADKKKVYGKKNILVLGERHHGRKHLLSQLLPVPLATDPRRRKRPIGQALALGYEVLQVRDEGDEEAVPPISVFYPASSARAGIKLVQAALPQEAIPDTAVVITLDWSRPGGMAKELITWLTWVEEWVGPSFEGAEELRERLQAHLQQYTEPPIASPSASQPAPASYGSNGPLLPLGPGALTLNANGIPVVVVCTKADMMDAAAEGSGLKGAAWEERCDWAQQVIRTICLAYGAALFYTAPTQPHTYSHLRSYLLHRLYSSDVSRDTTAAHTTSRFPFPHRANVLDRDAVMVPAGWDTWGKINVLRDGFDPASIVRAAERSLQGGDEDAGERLEEVWAQMIPDPSRDKSSNAARATSHVEPEQPFLSRQYDLLQKDPNRDPRAAFRQVSGTAPASSSEGAYGGYGGVVGPMGAGGLSLPGVEKAMAALEGQDADDLKEKFAKLGRKDRGPLSPSTPGPDRPATPAGGVPNEALHSFFQGLLASKGKSATAKPAE